MAANLLADAPEVVEVDGAPALMRLFVRAAVTAPGRSGDSLSGTVLVRRDVTIDRDEVAAFAGVVGASVSDTLPPTWLHMLAFPLSIQLMADRSFPMALPGMVHLRNRIDHVRPVGIDEVVTVATRLADLRPHPKGRQVDILAEASVAGELVWSSLSTYLSRGSGADEAAVTTTPPDVVDVAELPLTSVWRLGADQGRRYAAVSGDRNPIHMSALAARAFGFKRAIVHGMWTKAACLAGLEGRLGERFVADVAFRQPVLLPATVEYATATTDDGWAFGVRSRSGRPHLAGVVTP